MSIKTFEDLQTELRTQLKIWFKRQCLLPETSFYLYYREVTEDLPGFIIILHDKPGNKDFKLAMPERINAGLTIDQNFNHIFNTVLQTLPVLG